jgi:hypothetical protein
MAAMGMRRVALVAQLLAFEACAVAPGSAGSTTACAPAPDYFVSDVYPRYLDANQCGSGGCHLFDGGHGVLRLRPPEAPAPGPGSTLADWPLAWRENYRATIHLVRCDAPLASRLLRVPEGDDDLHPPGPVVLDRATAALVLDTWVTLP